MKVKFKRDSGIAFYCPYLLTKEWWSCYVDKEDGSITILEKNIYLGFKPTMADVEELIDEDVKTDD